MVTTSSLSRRMDRLVRPHVRVLGRKRSSFHVCGLTGLAAALALASVLAAQRDLSAWVLAGAALTACATFLALAMATKIVTGEEKLIYYHHEVAILTTVTLMLWAFRQPVLSYLDVTLLGVGTFLFCGRVGCFMVGCCHGRPHRWGVCYRQEHADEGFTRPFVGVRLFPIQLVESAWVFTTVLVGAWMVLRGAPPGAALAWYVVVYDVGRFGFEFLRGDARPYRAGFSEGQWTSLLLMLVVIAGEVRGVIPSQAWHVAAAAGMVATMIAVTLHRRRRGDSRHRLLSPRHIREVAEAVDLLAAAGAPTRTADGATVVNVARTSAGLNISAGAVEETGGVLRHYTLSGNAPWRRVDADAVGRLLIRLRHPDASGELVPGREGIFHFLIRTDAGSEGATPVGAGGAGITSDMAAAR
ncbi:MAG TPA: prolipoprotein diacylglyceryl transferase family protein [Longimicrobiaceae bacterium]